jgi:hypothetical protein
MLPIIYLTLSTQQGQMILQEVAKYNGDGQDTYETITSDILCYLFLCMLRAEHFCTID